MVARATADRAPSAPRTLRAVTVMMREHDDHGDNLKRTRALTNDFTPPAEACATWRAMCEELDRLEADLMAHLHLENHVLFPRALQEG